jgi:hypothetical protein
LSSRRRALALLSRRLALRRCRQPKPAAHRHAMRGRRRSRPRSPVSASGARRTFASHAKRRKGAEPKQRQRGRLRDCPMTFRGCRTACGSVRER